MSINNYLKCQWAKCATSKRYRMAESVKKKTKHEPTIMLPARDPLQGKGYTQSEVKINTYDVSDAMLDCRNTKVKKTASLLLNN